MASCCGTPPRPDSPGPAACPVSGARGVPVPLQTVKALLTPVAMRHVTQGAHRFCGDASCDVVYFSDDGQIYRTTDLRVQVWHKQHPGDRVVCYCFGENEADILVEIEATGASEAVQRVRAHIASARCACEIRNPRGVCCLGDVTTAVTRAAEGRQTETNAHASRHG